MSHATNGAGAWRAATISLLSVTATVFVGWVLLAGNAVSRDEVIRLISRETPYLEDRKAIQESLARQGATLDRLTEEVQRLRLQQQRLEAKVEAALALDPP